MSDRDNRAGAIITELAAKYIAREAGRSTLITPTRTEFSDRKHAIVYVSVFPESETEHALAFLRRHRDDFRNSLKKQSRLMILPFIEFQEDLGERNRQRLDELSNELTDGEDA